MAGEGAAAATGMLRMDVAEAGGVAESVRVTVKVEVPIAVPLISPVLPFSVSPAGKLPAVMLQVTAPVPPVECRVAEYAVFTIAPGSEVVPIPSGPGMLKGDLGNGLNPPAPSPWRTVMELSPLFATAMSGLPSPLKSATTTALG